MAMKRFLFGHLALVLISCLAGRARADYIFTTLDVPGGTNTEASGINNAGQIVGSSSAGGFLLSGGRYSPLSFSPSGINDSNQILGGNTLYSGGSYTTLTVPIRGATNTITYGINNSGPAYPARKNRSTPRNRHGLCSCQPTPRPVRNAWLIGCPSYVSRVVLEPLTTAQMLGLPDRVPNCGGAPPQ
jgi:hypothetical protein